METSSNKSAVVKAHLFAIICVIIWGSTVVTGKVIMVDFKPIEVALFRLIAAYIALVVLCPKIKRLGSWKDEFLCALAGFFGMCLFYVFDYSAFPYAPASNISIILAMSPVSTTIVGKIVDRKLKVNRFFVPGMIISIIGVILVVTKGDFSSLGGGMLGNGLLVCAIFCWSFYVLTVKKLGNYPALEITRKMFGYGIITMIPFLPLMHFAPAWSALFNVKYLLILFYMGCIGCGITYVWWNNSVQTLGAVKVDPYKYTMPVVTIIFSIIFLNETINMIGIIGVAVTLAGLFLTNKRS